MDDKSDRLRRRFRKLLGFVTGERSPLPQPTETQADDVERAETSAEAQDSAQATPAGGAPERIAAPSPPEPVAPPVSRIFAAPSPTVDRDDDLEQVLNENRIRSVFQPIVNLADGAVYGYEALSRGPIGTRLEGADALFSAAAAVGQTHRLERVCRFRSISAAAGIPSGCYLFLNLSPRVLEEQNAGLSREVIEQSRLAAERIVLEITEKQAIADFDLLKDTLLHYYRQGFKVAIDDAGAGHNSLRAVTEVRPHFIKLDMALVRDIDRERVKNALVAAIIIFAKRIDAKVLAEGIETVDELATLIEIGVDLGQGFLLGRPSSGFIEPKPEIAAFIRERSSTLRALPMPKRMAVSTITRRAPALMPTAYTAELLEIFERNADLDSVVLTEFGAPVGLVSRTKLYERLSQQFGYSLYSRRAARLVMDDSYLAVDAKDSIEEVARKVTHRRSTEMYDEVVVLEDGVYSGVVSVRDLLHTMTEFQATMARNTNPLTGLPGRIPLQQEIDRRCEANQPFAVLHIDLLNFRAYNERYGVERGDEVIALLAETLSTVVAESNDRQATVGHLGGVNFLALCEPGDVERLGRRIIESFARRTAPLHVTRDISAVEHGSSVPPSVGLSLVGITCTSPPLPNLASLAGRTARYKRVARAAGGNAFVIDGQLVAGRVLSFPQQVG
ncbi:MAG: EAL and GGDEF domain-containing protein [Candidatus Eremiobacteraeota bacterium]|nr:EAL and GGDEF domain-containing protein [Candidatus Eremiobacteraeota bacterium]